MSAVNDMQRALEKVKTAIQLADDRSGVLTILFDAEKILEESILYNQDDLK